MTLTITRPGIFDAVDEEQYHRHAALSQSAAKVLLDCPARYRWQLDNPRPPKDTYDIGHAAHAIVLGVGMDLVVVEADDWRTKVAQAAKKAAHEAGQVPLLRKDYEATLNMAEAVLRHPKARLILEREGDAEQSAWWTDYADDGTAVECRARFDWTTTTVDGLPALGDLKTTGKSAGPNAFTRSVVDYGYDLQEDWYCTGFEAITGQRPSLIFIVVEKEPPHFVAVHVLDPVFHERGDRLRRAALNVYAACSAADEWPAHGDDIHILTPPRWAS